MNRKNGYYEEDERDEDMSIHASRCRSFSRRGDFDVFSMSTYQSCENCRNLSPDDRCTAGMRDRIFPFE